MDFLPVFLDLKDRDCLVAGGGGVAARKVLLLRKAQARVTVAAPQLSAGLADLARNGQIVHHSRNFEAGDLKDRRLVFAATGDKTVNREVSELCRQRGILVNVADHPELCSFIMPSIIERSPMLVAVSSGGASPVLARLLRARLETFIPSAYGQLAALVKQFRDKVKQNFKEISQRKRFWEKVLQGPIAEMVLAGQTGAAAAALETAIQKAAGSETEQQNSGEVYLVGGGPGDPDLLTFRALRLMQQAETVVHDRLVSKAVLELTRRDAERIYVGKERDNHTIPQEDINRTLVDLAKQGKRVLRLKGGDPFIFGRGGEEIETLTAEGIPFQIVPGITAASGAASYAGIPLTHRDYAQSCVFVTGHLKDGSMDLNWNMLAQPHQTVAVYMGLRGLDTLCRQLIRHGMAADKPIALVQQATTRNQRVFTGTLESLPKLTENRNIRPPTLIIVGDVVKLHDTLAWFEPQK
ncbi:MAG: uroporphyrinogen-III C-methyltransferase [Gammaproteobacteria bacterium]|nr:uroporphyrinogen-III C-methyltransferase [Gammaproteobacteria bacterium]